MNTNIQLILWIVGGTFAIGLVSGMLPPWLGITLVGLVAAFFVAIATWFLMLGMPASYWPQYASPAAVCLLGYFLSSRLIKPLLT